jgi:hypothetical protein
MRFVMTVILMLVAAPACAEWVRLGESDAAVAYLDTATLEADGYLRRVWRLTDLKVRDPRGERSRTFLNEYDCKEWRVRTLSISIHSGPMATEKVIAKHDTPDDWKDVAPGTAGAEVLILVCRP